LAPRYRDLRLLGLRLGKLPVTKRSTGSLLKPSISMDPAGEVFWGQEVRITCSTAAELLGETFILQKISDSFRQTQLSPIRTATFTISKVNFDHDGSYRCQYEKTGSGQTFTSPSSDPLTISVAVNFSKPTISVSSADVSWGQEVCFTCSIHSQVFGGTFILKRTESSFKKTQTSSTNFTNFVISKADVAHDGSYQCHIYFSSHIVSSRVFAAADLCYIWWNPTFVAVHLVPGLSVPEGKKTQTSSGSFPDSKCVFKIFELSIFLKSQLTVLYHISGSAREDGGNCEAEYENLSGEPSPPKLTDKTEQDPGNDYEDAPFDETNSFEEFTPQTMECASPKSESQEEGKEKDGQETSNDNNYCNNVLLPVLQTVEI
uniref:Ig-like domain-containing protein n=1 Tax=Oryzias melastigma TaxID=30732 RepID=A0A3B3CK42_ORYME